MRYSFLTTFAACLFLSSTLALGQQTAAKTTADFGQPSKNTPPAFLDFNDLIGIGECNSTRRNPDGSWQKPEFMTWTWRYIMDGQGVQDESIKDNGNHSGNIRQYVESEGKWYVHWYNSGQPAPTLPTWTGGKKDDGTIVLYRDQKSPQGMEGFSKLTFYDISETGYKWVGEWVDKAEKIVYPTWRIECEKQR